MKCLHCSGELKKATAPFTVNRDDYHVHFNALPAWVCTQCGEPLFETQEVDRVQRTLQAIEQEMPSRSKVA